MERRVEAADGEKENPAAHPRQEAGGKRVPHQRKLIGQGQRQPEPGDDREQGRGKNSAAGPRNPDRDQDGPEMDRGGKQKPYHPPDPVNRSVACGIHRQEG